MQDLQAEIMERTTKISKETLECAVRVTNLLNNTSGALHDRVMDYMDRAGKCGNIEEMKAELAKLKREAAAI